MSVLLEIEDGNPWYLSPNVWTVPGNDPNGPAGIPALGQRSYMWANVMNKGDEEVENAIVNFYYSHPGLLFFGLGLGLSNTIRQVGTSNVSLMPGETKSVLCLVPWTPSFIDGPQQCILAEVFHPTLDNRTGALNPSTDRHVAQCNLVLKIVTNDNRMFKVPFEILNGDKVKHSFTVEAIEGTISEIEPLIPHLGRGFEMPRGEGHFSNLGFVFNPCPDPKDLEEAEHGVTEMKIEAQGLTGRTLMGELDGDAALVHIIQKLDDIEVGGLSILAINKEV